MQVYYHYTTPEAAMKIRRIGVIYESTETATGRDAVYGSGVYLTREPPTKSKFQIAFNNWDHQSESAIAKIIENRERCYCSTAVGLA